MLACRLRRAASVQLRVRRLIAPASYHQTQQGTANERKSGGFWDGELDNEIINTQGHAATAANQKPSDIPPFGSVKRQMRRPARIGRGKDAAI